MKQIILKGVLIMWLLNFFSCKDNISENKKEILLELKSNYSLYILVKTVDTTIISNDIKETISAEKYSFTVNNIIQILNDKWTVIKIDTRIQPNIFFVILGTLSEAKYGQVIGLGINTKEKSKSFYSFIGGKIYEETRGEYITGRLETSINFKYHLFNEDSANFVFEVVDSKENKKNIRELLDANKFNIDNLKIIE